MEPGTSPPLPGRKHRSVPGCPSPLVGAPLGSEQVPARLVRPSSHQPTENWAALRLAMPALPRGPERTDSVPGHRARGTRTASAQPSLRLPGGADVPDRFVSIHLERLAQRVSGARLLPSLRCGLTRSSCCADGRAASSPTSPGSSPWRCRYAVLYHDRVVAQPTPTGRCATEAQSSSAACLGLRADGRRQAVLTLGAPPHPFGLAALCLVDRGRYDGAPANDLISAEPSRQPGRRWEQH